MPVKRLTPTHQLSAQLGSSHMDKDKRPEVVVAFVVDALQPTVALPLTSRRPLLMSAAEGAPWGAAVVS